MFAFVRLTILASFFTFCAGSLCADIVVGSKREAVIAELGKPFSIARRGTREILLYPKNVRFELVAGEVVDIKGYTPAGAASATADAASPIPATAPSKPAQPNSPAPSAAPASPPGIDTAAFALEPGATPPSNPAATNRDRRSREPVDDFRDPAEPSLAFSVGVTAIMLVAQFLLTFVALKIAFHYHQMDALWSGIFAITGIDVALQTLFAVIIYFQSGEVRLGIAGTGLPGLAMIWSIRHFCLDQRWKRALATTGAVKIASILLNLGLLAVAAHFD